MSRTVPVRKNPERARKSSHDALDVVTKAFLAMLVLSVCCAARSHDPVAATFAIDLDKPFDEVLEAVNEVANNGVISGTFEYKGDQSLPGAVLDQNCQLFKSWSGKGKVFFKVRKKTLAPVHFLNSNDVGTVAVRYVVQEIGSNLTRLFIDAVFIENAGHHNHPSDGFVETSEFGEIGKRMREAEQVREVQRAGQTFLPASESSSRPDQPTQGSPDTQATSDLQRAISEQKSSLESDTAKLHRLEAEAQKLRSAEFLLVSVERAELKVQPYAHARPLEALKKGQQVTLLAKSSYWVRVRSEDGQEGWLPHSAVEARP
jgi:Bacterial SH3 domain